MARISIDAGHGWEDPGACGAYLKEKDVTLSTAHMLKQELESRGHEVLLVRPGDAPGDGELEYRVACSNEWGADIFVSIHCNAVANPAAHGTETFCFRGSFRGRQLAESIQPKLIAELGLTDRGVKEAGYYVLRASDAVAVLVELAFITNPTEEDLLASAGFQHKAADAIADGIDEYLA